MGGDSDKGSCQPTLLLIVEKDGLFNLEANLIDFFETLPAGAAVE
jgi:hypothetical protein